MSSIDEPVQAFCFSKRFLLSAILNQSIDRKSFEGWAQPAPTEMSSFFQLEGESKISDKLVESQSRRQFLVS